MKIDHVTAIVHNSREVCALLARLLGVEPPQMVELAGMAIGTFQLGAMELHVNAPTGDGPVKDYFASRGSGYHHLALEVAGLDAEIVRAEELGFRCLGRPVETAPGLREVFLDPATTGGILIQLTERTANVEASTLAGANVASLAQSLKNIEK